MSRISNNENKINYFIDKLPQDIIKNIYIKYITPDLICSELYLILNSIDSMRLNCDPLVEF